MFSKRSPFDLLFFIGAFLVVESILSFQWYLLFWGGVEVDNNVPVTAVQNSLLLLGVIFMSASVVCIRSLKRHSPNETALPSRRLFADFSFISGALMGITFFSYMGFCMECDWAHGAFVLSLGFLFPILIGTSVYLWNRDRKFAKRFNHSLAWEILSTFAISSLFIDLFVFSDGMFALPITTSPVVLVIAAICIPALISGLLAQERKSSKQRFGSFDPLNNYSARRLKIFLLAVSTLIVVGSTGLSMYASSQATDSCGGGGFGLYSCNVKTITMSSATLYSGKTTNSSSPATSYLAITLNNPGDATTISSLILSGPGLASGMITQWSSSSDGKSLINFQDHGHTKALNSTSVSSFLFYPFYNNSVESVVANEAFDYVINFANGQSVSGPLVAQ